MFSLVCFRDTSTQYILSQTHDFCPCLWVLCPGLESSHLLDPTHIHSCLLQYILHGVASMMFQRQVWFHISLFKSQHWSWNKYLRIKIKILIMAHIALGILTPGLSSSFVSCHSFPSFLYGPSSHLSFRSHHVYHSSFLRSLQIMYLLPRRLFFSLLALLISA